MQNQLSQHESLTGRRPTIGQRQFWVMVLATGLLLGVLAGIYFQERSKEWRLRVEQSDHRIGIAQEIIARDLERVRADLLFVASLPEIQEAGASDPDSLLQVSRIFQDFANTQQTYAQIRLISRTGKEVARVDWDGSASAITESSNLQDKADRYYVSESLELKVGQIFTSEFDLNLEQGQIEKPLNPVIRFVTPVQQHGKVGCLLVFNYQGASLLSELSEISLPGRTYLVRADGEFLLGPIPETEWGWLLGHSDQFATSFAGVELQSLIDAEEPVHDQAGIFKSQEIQLERDMADSVRQPLFFVSHIPTDESFPASRQLLNWLLLVGGTMMIPLALITRFWAAAVDRKEWQGRKIAQSEKRLRQLSAQLIGLQEEERRSLSREIHDSLGQQATAINLDLRMLKEKLPDQPQLDRVIDESGQLLSSLHGFATRVRPAELDDLGLREAIESHVWEFMNRTGIECEFRFHPGSDSMEPSMETHVFRIIQEALNNISKHADANIASVALKTDQQANELKLVITDDGVGIESEPDSSRREFGNEKRLGVLGIRERVELLRGKMNLESAAGRGTTLKVWIPISRSVENQIEASQ